MNEVIEMDKVEETGDKDVQEVIDIVMNGLFSTLKNDMPDQKTWKSYEMKVTFNAKEKVEGTVTIENMIAQRAVATES